MENTREGFMIGLRRFKSTSKGGQDLKDRAKESNGARKKELKKIEKADAANYASAPRAVKRKVDKSYQTASKARVKNKGKFI